MASAYKQYYNLDDDNEIKWLAWYVKTVRVSKLLASQTKKAINITQLSNQYIEWFHAFCYRRANDANWLKDTPYPVKDLMKKEPDNTYAILLQRIAYHHVDLRRCFIAEQCQSIGEAFTRRFWRLRKLFLNDVHYKFNTKQFLISDKFVVTINGQTNSTNLIHKKPCTISIWPVHQLLFMRPRQFSCLCDNASIRGRWMMINYLEPVAENTNNSNVLRNTRIFDLANGQMCMGTITTYQGETFLLRVNEESATVFSRSLYHSDTTTTLKWNVWEFSNCHLGYGPRCLMQGEIRFKKSNDSAILVRKLDDNLV
ncbi:hypothetical protein BDF19DRAFT_422171 [Syncephalis fuscata]|nr:hypothetical protein BDF19DRAFT_422171 [Syncephalis fuscata]